jgi:hypothetical protein
MKPNQRMQVIPTRSDRPVILTVDLLFMVSPDLDGLIGIPDPQRSLKP